MKHQEKQKLIVRIVCFAIAALMVCGLVASVALAMV